MKKLFILLFIFVLVSCSKKAKDAIIEDTPTEQTEANVKPVSKANCKTLDDLPAGEVNDAKRAFTIFRTLMKQNEFDLAAPHWQKAYNMAPGANGKVKYHFNDGVKIYTHKYQQATDESKKAMMLDTINMIYAKRLECYPEDKSLVLGKQAYHYYYDMPGAVSEDEIFDLFKQSFDLEQEKSKYYFINPFTALIYSRVVDGKISKEEGAKYASIVSSAIEKGPETCKGKECAGWEDVKAYSPDLLESLEGVDGFYDCEYYAKKYYAYYKADPTNCEFIGIAYGNMARGGCGDADPRYTEVKNAYNKLCRQTEVATAPVVKKKKVTTTRTSVVREAYQLYKAKQFQQAVDKYDEYLQTITDPMKASKYNMKIARIYYRDIKNFPKARKYALAAAKLRPNWGEPYLEIGKLYASSGKLCGPGTGFKSQVVTWPAIDMFKKAKRVDPSIAAEANKWINRYSKFMPKKADIFLRNIPDGSTYKVECWIQRSTKVRTAD